MFVTVAAGMPAIVGDSTFAITQSAFYLTTGLASANADSHTINGIAKPAPIGTVPASSVPLTLTTYVPSNAILEQGICQLQQLVAKGVLSGGSITLANGIATTAAADVTGYNNLCSTSSSTSLVAGNDGGKKEELIVNVAPFVQLPPPSRRQTNTVERKKRPKKTKNNSSVAITSQPSGSCGQSSKPFTVNAAGTATNSSATAAFAMCETTPANAVSLGLSSAESKC